ncbi:MAG: hypothetical protein ACREOO_11755 [bacterium]
MDTVITVSVAFIAFCMLLIMVAIVATLLRVRSLLLEVQKFVETARLHVPPLMHDVTQISSDVRSIVRSVERDMPKLSRAMDSLRAAASDIHDLERAMRERIERPLLGLSAVAGGLLRGVYTFWRKLLG